jgi:poly-D-alanine transfer protein DltD
MSDDFYVADAFPFMIGAVQAADVKAAEERREKERQAAKRLREQQGSRGVNMSELVKQLSDDQDADKRAAKLTKELDRINAESAEAVKKEKSHERPEEFPAPVFTTGE